MSNAFILASGSPRRLELLGQLGLEPTVQPVDIDESPLRGESGLELVRRLAESKAMAISESEVPVLGADTIVMLGSQVYGKPTSRLHFLDMLLSISGRKHEVITSVCVCAGSQKLTATVHTIVTMSHISDAAAEQYWQTGEPNGKAGGYAIQGKGAVFVEHLEGSYSNVVGLPLYESAQLLSKVGINSI